MNDSSRQLPRRSSKYGVGKEIAGAVYLHRNYENRLGNVVRYARANLSHDFDYRVVKYNFRAGAVSFIQCDDFDSNPEPTVGEIVRVDVAGNVRRRGQPRDPEIYHHKWLFVDDDYEGFDVDASRQRSLAWIQLDGIDRSRIGRQSYWNEFVVSRLNDINCADS